MAAPIGRRRSSPRTVRCAKRASSKNRDGTPDGGVHALFTITGRPGATGCSLTQPDFDDAAREPQRDLPHPDAGVRRRADRADPGRRDRRQPGEQPRRRSSALGIRGRPISSLPGRTITGQTNNNGNDGTIARFGWKAQNKSLLLFSGEAYNVEMGITNELFQTERDENAAASSPAVAQQRHRTRKRRRRSTR